MCYSNAETTQGVIFFSSFCPLPEAACPLSELFPIHLFNPFPVSFLPSFPFLLSFPQILCPSFPSLPPSFHPYFLKSDFSWVILHSAHRTEKMEWMCMIKSWEINWFFSLCCMWRNYKPTHITVERQRNKAECICGYVIWKWLLAKILSGAAASDTHHLSLIIRTKFKFP